MSIKVYIRLIVEIMLQDPICTTFFIIERYNIDRLMHENISLTILSLAGCVLSISTGMRPIQSETSTWAP